MAGESRTVHVTIRLDKASAGQLEEIVRRLETSGLTNFEVHERFLVVNGSVAAARVDKLRDIDGVASVKEDRTYKALRSRG